MTITSLTRRLFISAMSTVGVASTNAIAQSDDSGYGASGYGTAPYGDPEDTEPTRERRLGTPARSSSRRRIGTAVNSSSRRRIGTAVNSSSSSQSDSDE